MAPSLFYKEQVKECEGTSYTANTAATPL